MVVVCNLQQQLDVTVTSCTTLGGGDLTRIGSCVRNFFSLISYSLQIAALRSLGTTVVHIYQNTRHCCAYIQRRLSSLYYYLYISMYSFLSSFNVGVQHHVCHSVFFCSFTRVIFFSRLVAFAFCSCCATRLCKDPCTETSLLNENKLCTS